MLTPDIYIGNAKVFLTGTLIVANDEPVRLLLFGPGSQYFLEMRFSKGDGQPGLRNFNEGHGHVILFENLETSNTPISNSLPIYVANSSGRRLHMNVSVHTVGSAPVTRQINYTMFDGGAAT